MTTHKEADVEVAELKDRYAKVKAVADEWMKKCNFLITQLPNSIPGWLKIVEQKANRTSLWKKWSPHWENSKTSSKKKKSWWKIFKRQQKNLLSSNNKKNLHTYISTTTTNDIMDIMLAFILFANH